MARDINGLPGIEAPVRVASGGSGVLYRAWQPDLDREVAVKVVEFPDDAARRRFERERRAMGRLSQHPGILTVYDSGLLDERTGYLVLPFLHDGSVQDRLDRDGPVPWPEAVDLVAQVSVAVAAAHQQGVLHRDVKPANVLLSSDGTPLLSDFGIARSADGPHTSDASFTPLYAAPEAVQGEDPSPATDVYGLGCLLFALLTGRPPFGEAAGGLAGLGDSIVGDPVPALPEDVPASVQEVVEAALAKAPEDRPAPAAFQELAARLDQPGLEVAPAPPPQDHRRPRHITFAAISVALIVAVAWLSGALPEGPPAQLPEVASAPQIPPQTTRRTQDPEMVTRPEAQRADPQTSNDNTDPAAYELLTIPTGGEPLTPARHGDDVWVVRDEGDATGALVRIDAMTGAVLDTVRVGSHPRGPAIADDTAWVHNVADGTLSAIDTTRVELVRVIDLHDGYVPFAGGDAHPTSDDPVVDDHGSVWVADTVGGRLFVVRPDGTSEQLPLASGTPVRPVVVDGVAHVPTTSWCTGFGQMSDLPIPAFARCATVDRFEVSTRRSLEPWLVPRVPWDIDRVDPGGSLQAAACRIDQPDACIATTQPAESWYESLRGESVVEAMRGGWPYWQPGGVSDGGALWLSMGLDAFDALLRLDAATMTLASYGCVPSASTGGPTHPAFGDSVVWLAEPLLGNVCAIPRDAAPVDHREDCSPASPPRCGSRPRHESPAPPLVVENPGQPVVAGTGERVWVPQRASGELLLLDLDESGGPRVIAEVRVGPGVGVPLVDGNAVWVPSTGRLTRLTPAAGDD